MAYKLIGLTDREKLFYTYFKKHKNLTPDDLVQIVTKNLPAGKKIPKHIRASVIVTVKYLNSKIAREGYYIERVSEIGRGNKAIFQLKRVRA